MQRALDALIVHAYETMSEFFHKVFNTTVENVLSPRIFSSGQIGSHATANAEFLRPNGNCVAAMGVFLAVI